MIADDDPRKSELSNLDYLVEIEGRKLYADVKNSPVLGKASFKTGELVRIVNTNGIMLLFINTGYFEQEPAETWDSVTEYMGTEAVKSLLTLRQMPDLGERWGDKKGMIFGPYRTDYGLKKLEFEELFELYELGGTKKWAGPCNKFVDFGERTLEYSSSL